MLKFKLGDLCIKRVPSGDGAWSIEGPSGSVFEAASYQVTKAFCAWHMNTRCSTCGDARCDSED